MANVERFATAVGEGVRLIHGDARAELLPSFGFNCYSWRVAARDRLLELLDHGPDFPAPAARGSAHGIPILAPFPNRIAGGGFRLDCDWYESPKNDRGENAIHGFVMDQPWRLLDAGADDATGAWARAEFHLSRDRPDYRNCWPNDFILRVEYQLHGRRLRTIFVIENQDDISLPFGLGTHPYFRIPFADATDWTGCELWLPKAKKVVLDHCLPTGELKPAGLRHPQPLLGRSFDDVFMLTSREGDAVHRLRDVKLGVELTMTTKAADWPFVVIYTPPHGRSICIEPYTCVTNAVNLEGVVNWHTGWRYIAAGASVRYELTMELHESS